MIKKPIIENFTYRNIRGTVFYLKSRVINQKGKDKVTGLPRTKTIYFFGKHPGLNDCPWPGDHKVVGENKNGMPYLKNAT